MVFWKLYRQEFGTEEYILPEGKEITVGRGQDNTIVISSLVISRNHCVLKVKDNEVTITDLKSSNGVYIGKQRIPPSIPHTIQHNTIIGIGWINGVNIADIDNKEKYIFKLVKQEEFIPIIKRLKYQEEISQSKRKPICPIIDIVKSENTSDDEHCTDSKQDIVCILSDSDIETKHDIKKSESTIAKKDLPPDAIKLENDDLQYEAFTIKQEYLGDNDEPIQVDSESDSESEHWYLRLSQSSPGKPFTKVNTEPVREKPPEDNSYSQWDDVLSIEEDGDIYLQDLIQIPLEPLSEKDNVVSLESHVTKESEAKVQPDIQLITKTPIKIVEESSDTNSKSNGFIEQPYLKSVDVVDHNESVRINTTSAVDKLISNVSGASKKIQVIDPLSQPHKRKAPQPPAESKKKRRRSNKHSSESSRKTISNSQKEERKKKLKEIANKNKDEQSSKCSNNNKSVVNIKNTNSNRGEFFSNVVEPSVKPIKRKESPKEKSKEQNKSARKESKERNNIDVSVLLKDKPKSKKQGDEKTKKNTTIKNHNIESKNKVSPESVKVNSINCDDVNSVEKLQSKDKKVKKSVRFSTAEPEIRYFEIEPGNKLKETRLVKTTLVDTRQLPIFSLEKITLMKILRWNPSWLSEQITNTEPPPILGHNNIPLAKFQSYNNHKQYVQLIGDLLLMEIWECLTQGHMKTRNQPTLLNMRIENLPPLPPMERYAELFNLSVNISMPTSEAKNAPRTGDVLVIEFGPEHARNSRFFFVHNVRTLPAPPQNRNTFFSIALYTTFTEKMKLLRTGELIIGRNLAYINKELMLFEAMEFLSGSPLTEAILKPEPRHFQAFENNTAISSPWMVTLNESQKRAVMGSVSAALSDRPTLQMVQGPPGTGKSSVICSIVMAYFYDANGKKQHNRGKILICATSNAAIDELVTRLLSIRQSLPKQERFKMVRVGREEAMHVRARDVSSQQLAVRGASRPNDTHSHLAEQISHLDAKINMWQTAMRDAKDPVRVAYCQGRITQLSERKTLLRQGGGGSEELRPDRLMAAEKRIIDCADIVATTLASAQNHKMKGLKGRIALCIIDEAGQAIEPETLAPLTLDVTKITLVGDPQQLPGFICSQRAKKHGLGESLFARLTSYTELWSRSPVLLLDQQYRMHPDIADYPNRAFYAGKIRTVPRPAVDINIAPYTVIGISSGDKGQGASGANEMEACAVSRLASALHELTRAHRLSFAVITPYAAHRDLIKNYLRHKDNLECGVEVSTVDSFQGQERDVVVVSLARSSGLGFLTDAGRMNVMLTRARHALVVCLNPHAVTRNDQWRTLVEDAQARKVYITLPSSMCKPPAGRPDDSDILRYVRS